jgi:hypothetical protein
MISDIIHVCDFFINFQFGNTFYCSAFIIEQGEFLGVLEALAYDERISQLDRGKIYLHWCYSYSLTMDELKSQTNVNHVEWAIVHYIFCLMYEKIVFDVMDNKSV